MEFCERESCVKRAASNLLTFLVIDFETLGFKEDKILEDNSFSQHQEIILYERNLHWGMLACVFISRCFL